METIKIILITAMPAIWIAAGLGWCLNILKILGTMDAPITGLFALRCIGIICAPIGAILGYF